MVDVDGGADQGQVGERLWEVPERLAGWADLLGVQPEVVRVSEHLLERQARLVEAAGAGERLDPPEGADREGPLLALQPVRGGLDVVAVDEAVRAELLADQFERREPT